MKAQAPDIKIVEEAKQPLAMHPKKFAMWLFMASVAMLFLAWTSAYLVKRGEPGWSSFEMPFEFSLSSVLIVLSSLSMIYAHRSAGKDQFEAAKLGMGVTSLLGLAFLVFQFLGWKAMVEQGYHFTGMGSNTSSSFIYVLTFFHGLHLVSAIIFLLVVFVRVFRMEIHSKNMASMEMCSTYWHFLGVLWLYLFVFLLLFR